MKIKLMLLTTIFALSSSTFAHTLALPLLPSMQANVAAEHESSKGDKKDEPSHKEQQHESSHKED